MKKAKSKKETTPLTSKESQESKKSLENSKLSILVKALTTGLKLILLLFERKQKQTLKVELTPHTLNVLFTSPDPYLVRYVHDAMTIGIAQYTNKINTDDEEEPVEQTRVLGFVQNIEEEDEEDGD